MLPVWCDECRRFGRPFTVLTPYTTPRLNAACFGTMSVGVLGEPLLCYLYTAPRLNAACLGAMNVGVSDDPLLCFPPTLCMG